MLAIDQSYTRFGIAIVQRASVENAPEIVQIASYAFRDAKPVPRTKYEKRRYLRVIVQRWLEFGPDAVVMEAVRPFPSNLHTITSLSGLVYAVRDMHALRGVPLYTLNTAHWKAKVLGNGRADKNDAIDFLLANYSDMQYDDDAADAACMGIAMFVHDIEPKDVD